MNMILLRQGDDSNALGGRIEFTLETQLDLTGFRAIFQLQNFRQTFEDITSKKMNVLISASDAAQLMVGKCFGAIKIFDANGYCKTIYDNIPFYIKKQVVE